MRGNFLCFSLERNCGLDIWSSNLENSYIFQGACHNSGRVWTHSKSGWVEKLFSVCFLFFFSFSSSLGLWHTMFPYVVWDFATKTLERKEPSSVLWAWYCSGYPAGILKRTDDRYPMTDTEKFWSLNNKSNTWAKAAVTFVCLHSYLPVSKQAM